MWGMTIITVSLNHLPVYRFGSGLKVKEEVVEINTAPQRVLGGGAVKSGRNTNQSINRTFSKFVTQNSKIQE